MMNFNLDASDRRVENSMCESSASLQVLDIDIGCCVSQQKVCMLWLVAHNGPVQGSQAFAVLQRRKETVYNWPYNKHSALEERNHLKMAPIGQ